MSSSLFAGRMLTKVRMLSNSSSSCATTSTIPASLLWNAAFAVFSVLLPSNAFGELTNSFAFFASINVKSVRAGTTAIPPPQVPKTAVICGTTPDARAWHSYSLPNASNASVASSNLIPAQSTRPITGAPTFIARL